MYNNANIRTEAVERSASRIDVAEVAAGAVAVSLHCGDGLPRIENFDADIGI